MPTRKLNGNLVSGITRTLKRGLPLQIIAKRHGIARGTLHRWIKTGSQYLEADNLDDYTKWCVKLFIAYETRAADLIESQYELLSRNTDPKLALKILKKLVPEDWLQQKKPFRVAFVIANATKKSRFALHSVLSKPLSLP